MLEESFMVATITKATHEDEVSRCTDPATLCTSPARHLPRTICSRRDVTSSLRAAMQSCHMNAS